MLAYYVIEQMTRLAKGLRVYPERMIRNLDASFGLVFSQPVLLALIESGKSRDDAYRIVQRNAMRAWDEELDFRELVRSDDEIARRIDPDEAFDLSAYTRHVDTVFSRLQSLAPREDPVHV